MENHRFDFFNAGMSCHKGYVLKVLLCGRVPVCHRRLACAARSRCTYMLHFTSVAAREENHNTQKNPQPFKPQPQPATPGRWAGCPFTLKVNSLQSSQSHPFTFHPTHSPKAFQILSEFRVPPDSDRCASAQAETPIIIPKVGQSRSGLGRENCRVFF